LTVGGQVADGAAWTTARGMRVMRRVKKACMMSVVVGSWLSV
jgi:hypothetical protein